jgi:hypothetical protein
LSRPRVLYEEADDGLLIFLLDLLDGAQNRGSVENLAAGLWMALLEDVLDRVADRADCRLGTAMAF